VSVGFRGLWGNRAKMPDEYFDFAPQRVLSDLNSLATLG
jgi:2-haloacid dehalogenase